MAILIAAVLLVIFVSISRFGKVQSVKISDWT
jgi:hypothetical protein